ncbi:MAG: TauD/TfdA family dioxygenase [Lentisphaerae bacterium]|nr:TauD/TfdA family dioxygenase [Lentisphaerota bacterium]
MHRITVNTVSAPFQRHDSGSVFPLLQVCDSPTASLADTAAWVHANRDELDAKLGQHAAILFRGFPLRDAEAFDTFLTAFGYESFTYKESLSNAVRVNRTERVFTANEAPADFNIQLHHEMAQTPVYPSKLFFFCQTAAETGGATPVCRSDDLYDALCRERPEFMATCEKVGLRYTNYMPTVDDPSSGMGRSWQSTFRATTREEAESRLHGFGYDWEWRNDGSLCATTPVLQAVRTLKSGRKSFFNQLIAAFKGWKDGRNDPAKAITFGDGSPMDAAAVDRAAELADAITVDLPWQAGDICLLDNYAAMHGRRTFTGTRQILAALVKGEMLMAES